MITGEDVIIQFRLKTINFTDFICATDCTIEGVTETTSGATLGTGSWARLVPLTNSYKISIAGLIPLDGSSNNNPFDLFEGWMNKTPVKFRMVFLDAENIETRALEGEALITSNSIAGPASGFATGDITLDGMGPLIIATDLCSTAVGTISGSDGAYTITSIPVTTIRIDYELFREGQKLRTGSLVPVAGSASIGFIGLPLGDYTMIFYPICSNGLSGIAQQRTFTIS
jgi:hypothetical protein